jgi:hypothetical protein
MGLLAKLKKIGRFMRLAHDAYAIVGLAPRWAHCDGCCGWGLALRPLPSGAAPQKSPSQPL